MDLGVSDAMRSVYIYYTIIYTGIYVHYLFVHVLLYTVVCTSTPLYTSTALYVYTIMNTPNILSHSIVYTGMWSFPPGRSRTRRWWASTCRCSSYLTVRNKRVGHASVVRIRTFLLFYACLSYDCVVYKYVMSVLVLYINTQRV